MAVASLHTDNGATEMQHPFERAGLGLAPFQCVGHRRMVYQACHGAPLQPGGACDYCGTGIMDAYLIRSSDGKTFKVGCDCVAKTLKSYDPALVAGVKRERKTVDREKREARNEVKRAARRAEHEARRAQWAAERAEREAAWKVEREAREAARLEEARKHRHLGTIGERLRKLAVTAERVSRFPAVDYAGRNVTRYVVRYRDVEGNLLIAFADHPHVHIDEAGDPLPEWRNVIISGTIKKHESYKEEPQTVLQRIKVEQANPEAPTAPVAVHSVYQDALHGVA